MELFYKILLSPEVRVNREAPPLSLHPLPSGFPLCRQNFGSTKELVESSTVSFQPSCHSPISLLSSRLLPYFISFVIEVLWIYLRIPVLFNSLCHCWPCSYCSSSHLSVFKIFSGHCNFSIYLPQSTIKRAAYNGSDVACSDSLQETVGRPLSHFQDIVQFNHVQKISFSTWNVCLFGLSIFCHFI